MLEIVVTVLLALLLVLLGWNLFAKRSSTTPPLAPKTTKQPCPLCGSVLTASEKVHSVVYATKTQDKLMEISGCPHCRPPSGRERCCPVCHQVLRPQDVVTARVFERSLPTGGIKTHVHVLGCPRCRK